MILLDSSGWIEYLTKGPLANTVHSEIKQTHNLLVPTIVLFEVYRKISRMVSQDEGLSVSAYLNTFTIIELTREISLYAADLSIEFDLGMADSCILATAYTHNATLITLDKDFRNIPHVKLLTTL